MWSNFDSLTNAIKIYINIREKYYFFYKALIW